MLPNARQDGSGEARILNVWPISPAALLELLLSPSKCLDSSFPQGLQQRPESPVESYHQ